MTKPSRTPEDQAHRDLLAKVVRILRQRKAVYVGKSNGLYSMAGEAADAKRFSYWLDRAEAVKTTAEAHDYAIRAVLQGLKP